MRRARVCIYGGTDLKGAPTRFIAALAYRVLRSMDAVIVTGGFHHSNDEPTAISTDVAALEGARRFAAESGRRLDECYEAVIPERAMDKRPDVDGAVRLTEQDGIAVRVMPGRTPLGRRLAMVAGDDLVITISGRRHTEVVVEQALELGVPVLPIPDAGGDSEDLLKEYRRRIAGSFADGALDVCLGQVSRSIGHDPELAARAVVDLVRTAKVGRCLVLMPYDPELSEQYGAVEKAVAEHMFPLRLDQLPESGAIYASFADAIRSSSAVIADITRLNENVMYEIGYAHGHGLTPLIYTRDPARLERLPVYFRTLNVHVATDGTSVKRLIDDYLRSVKNHHASTAALASEVP
jgi:hypothetical protein